MEIQIKGMIGRREQKHYFILPDNWGQVDAEKIVKIAPLLFSDTPHNRIECVKELLPKKSLDVFLYLNAVQVYEITKQFDWLYSQAIPDMPAIKSFRAGRETLFLPKEWLKNAVLIEFTFADNFLEKIIAGQSQYLDKLIIALCRPKRTDKYKREDWDGDVREKFNPELLEERIPWLAKVDISTKMYILLWFISCKKSLAKRYPVLFTERTEQKSANPNFGWLGVIYDLAGSLTNEEAIQYKNLHNCLFFMVKKYHDNKELEERQKQQNDYI
jgi:hypothetical protein